MNFAAQYKDYFEFIGCNLLYSVKAATVLY